MKRREAPSQAGVPDRLWRYVADEWPGPQSWYDAHAAWAVVNGDTCPTHPDTEWPSVPFDYSAI